MAVLWDHGGKIVHDLVGKIGVTLFARHFKEHRKPMGRREIHLGRAGVDEARAFVAEEMIAEEIADLAGRGQSRGVTRDLVPEQQAEHRVIVAPGVPGGPSVATDVGREPVRRWSLGNGPRYPSES